MEFHPRKCNVRIVTWSRSLSVFNYTLHGTTLPSTGTTKCVGVALTQDITWGKHVDNIRAKANQQLAIVRRNVRAYSACNALRKSGVTSHTLDAHPRILIQLNLAIAPTLQVIFEKTHREGVVPFDLRRAYICSI